jgi:signal transduction histidine kinase
MNASESTVLVVDDNPATRYSTSRVLRSGGFQIREAATGAEALKLADANVDLVVLDINLPDADGFDICRQLRSQPETARMSIVHLSATFVGEMDKVEGLNAGADGYLTHPVEPPVLIATVKAFLRARSAESERERLLESERAARADAERANRLKDDFLATLSHELRTPLNAILGWSDVLIRQPREADFTQGLQAIERNARLQAQLISDLLDVSRITSGKLRLELELVDLSSVLDSALLVVSSAAEVKETRIQRVGEMADAGMVLADSSRLQQVIWNLLSNAIKFTPKGGVVQVGVQRVGSQVQLQVSDNGRGIEADFLPHIFERFRQSDTGTTRSSSGLGLGLAIVKNLVEMHGGSVSAQSDGKNQGSTFTVLLPLASLRSANSDPATSVTKPTASSEATPLTNLRVLIVEDDDDARLLLMRVLREAGAEVAEADGVDAALDLIADFTPNVIVSDIGMSPRDGYELIRRIRAQGITAQQLPAVALTAFARMEDRRDVLLAGYQMHLAKPADPQELVAAIASLAGRTGPRRSA